MIKFKNYFLNEEFSVNKILELLNQCKPFLNDWKKTNMSSYLYSGRKANSIWFEKNVRKDRKPMSTPIDVHNIIDKRFHEIFGIKARSQSIFCVSDINMAKSYGKAYYIFPKGKYDIIWSNEISDLYTELQEYIAYNEKSLSDFPVLEKLNKSFEPHKKYFDYLENKFPIKKLYQKGNLKQALQYGYEIMLHCNEYIGIEYPKNSLENIIRSNF